MKCSLHEQPTLGCKDCAKAAEDKSSIELTKDEKREIENDVYRAIYPALMKREVRGFNSHPRAQIISSEVTRQVNEWINLQRRNKE